MAWGHSVATVVIDATDQQGFRFGACDRVIVALVIELGLHRVKEITIEDGGLLAGEDLALEGDLADVEPIAQKMGERPAGEWDAANRAPGLERSHLGDDASLAKVDHQAIEAAELQIPPKDGPDPLSLLFNHDDLAVLGLISERGYAPDPQPLALGGCDLVADTLGGDLPLELGERQQDIERQPPHRGRGIELLGDRDEGHAMTIEQLHELSEVGQRAGQPIDLIDDNDVNLPGPDVSQQPLQRRPLGRAPGITAVIVSRPDQGPAGMRLTADVGLRGIVLGVQRVEVLLKPMVRRHTGVDGASNRLGGPALHGRASNDGLSRRPKNRGPLQREPVIAKATLDRLRYVLPFQVKPPASTMTCCK